MRLLAAAAGQQPDDFSYATPGELVMLAPNCTRAELDQDDDCGCSRTFAGLVSHRGTTVATVIDLDTDLEMLALLVADSIRDAGWDIEATEAREIAEEMVSIAEDLPLGAVVRRDYEDVIVE